MNATNLKIYHDPSEHREHLDDYDRQPPTQKPQPPGQLDDNTNPSQEDQTNNNSHIPDRPQTANGTGEATPPTDDETSQHQDQPMPALPQDPNNFLAGRFRNGRREIRVEWDDGTKTWEPDHCFDGEVLDEINRKFTKIRTRRKTCFNRKH